jgi:hypothetical protein
VRRCCRCDRLAGLLLLLLLLLFLLLLCCPRILLLCCILLLLLLLCFTAPFAIRLTRGKKSWETRPSRCRARHLTRSPVFASRFSVRASLPRVTDMQRQRGATLAPRHAPGVQGRRGIPAASCGLRRCFDLRDEFAVPGKRRAAPGGASVCFARLKI